MKKYLVISAIMIYLCSWLYLDFSWDERVINQVSNDGWIPAAVDDSHVIHPWNFIKCSVVGIWFVNTSGMFRISDDIVMAGVMHIDRDEGQSNSLQLFDCSKKLTAYTSIEGLKTGGLTNLEWHSFEKGTPGAQLIEFISSRLSTIPEA